MPLRPDSKLMRDLVPDFPSEEETRGEKLKRLLLRRDFDPELTELLGRLKIFSNPVNTGRLKFHGEIPGVNGNRWYLGMKYQF